MKKIFFLLLGFLAFFNANAQLIAPVKWKTTTEKLNDTEFNLVFEGTIDNGWHVYSQFTPDGGPLPLLLDFKNQKGQYTLIGKTVESKTKRAFNDVFGVDEIYFEMIEKTTNCEESVLKNLANNFKAVDVLQLSIQNNLANEINETFREANLELNLLREQLYKSEHDIPQLKVKLEEIAEISKHFASSNYFEFKLLFNHEHFGFKHFI
jgi:hypothetical protein